MSTFHIQQTIRGSRQTSVEAESREEAERMVSGVPDEDWYYEVADVDYEEIQKL